jgi:hypothetical protein
MSEQQDKREKEKKSPKKESIEVQSIPQAQR